MTGGLVQREASAALRERSLARLQQGFGRYVRRVSLDPSTAWGRRDLMVDMTPFIDCARRLGHDPALALGPIAAAGADWLRDSFDSFVQRTDITLAAFGWSVKEDRDGQVYEFD